MPAFLVRVSATSGLATAREFVGIVVADSAAEIAVIVDEFTDPGVCEYSILPPGMIYARDGAPDVPKSVADDDGDGGEDDDFWSGAAVSEAWREQFRGEADETGAAVWLSFEDLILLEGTAH